MSRISATVVSAFLIRSSELIQRSQLRSLGEHMVKGDMGFNHNFQFSRNPPPSHDPKERNVGHADAMNAAAEEAGEGGQRSHGPREAKRS
jgi:hypothetical protein